MSNDGGQAFPTPSTSHQYGCPGMTLRDYFAAAALTGLLADSSLNLQPRQFAVVAFDYADCMLDERASQ